MIDREAIAAIATDLAGTTVRSLHPAQPGGNNRIFRINGENGKTYALKIYPSQDADPRDRLGAEWAALCFMAEHDLGPAPTPIASDPAHRCGLYSWVEGRTAEANADSIAQMADFLIALQAPGIADQAATFRPASAACFSGGAVLAQFADRRRRLDAAARDNNELASFLADTLDPAAAETAAGARAIYNAAGIPFEQDLDGSQLCLSPSDVGLHNVLADDSGRLTFLDFEYFGWDDPAKAVSDIVLHPGSMLPDALAATFVKRIVPVFAKNDTLFPVRLKALYPLFALIWCLIVLNEFLPERWERRVLAGGSNDRDAAQTRQLDKARRRIASLRNLNDIAPSLA